MQRGGDGSCLLLLQTFLIHAKSDRKQRHEKKCELEAQKEMQIGSSLLMLIVIASRS